MQLFQFSDKCDLFCHGQVKKICNKYYYTVNSKPSWFYCPDSVFKNHVVHLIFYEKKADCTIPFPTAPHLLFLNSFTIKLTPSLTPTTHLTASFSLILFRYTHVLHFSKLPLSPCSILVHSMYKCRYSGLPTSGPLSFSVFYPLIWSKLLSGKFSGYCFVCGGIIHLHTRR